MSDSVSGTRYKLVSNGKNRSLRSSLYRRESSNEMNIKAELPEENIFGTRITYHRKPGWAVCEGFHEDVTFELLELTSERSTKTLLVSYTSSKLPFFLIIKILIF